MTASDIRHFRQHAPKGASSILSLCLLQTIRESSTPLSISQLAATCSSTEEAVRPILRSLTATGYIEKTQLKQASTHPIVTAYASLKC